MRSQVSGVCVVMVLLLFSMPAVVAEGTTGIMAEPLGNTVKDVGIKEPIIALEKIGVSPGKEFDYTIQVYNVTDLANMDFSLTYENFEYDFKKLKCKSIEKGSLNSNSIFDYKFVNYPYCIDWECKEHYDSIRIAFVSATPLKGSGSIAVLRCSLNNEVRHPFIMRIVNLNSQSSSGEEISWQIVPGAIAYGRSIKGDCDSDGYASTRDALMIIQMSVGKISMDMGCDFNSDGVVNSADAREILRFSQTAGLAGQSGLISGAASGTGTGQGNTAALPIPLPNPQNLGIGGKGNEQRGVTPITIPRVADKTGGKGFDPIPIP